MKVSVKSTRKKSPSTRKKSPSTRKKSEFSQEFLILTQDSENYMNTIVNKPFHKLLLSSPESIRQMKALGRYILTQVDFTIDNNLFQIMRTKKPKAFDDGSWKNAYKYGTKKSKNPYKNLGRIDVDYGMACMLDITDISLKAFNELAIKFQEYLEFKCNKNRFIYYEFDMSVNEEFREKISPRIIAFYNINGGAFGFDILAHPCDDAKDTYENIIFNNAFFKDSEKRKELMTKMFLKDLK